MLSDVDLVHGYLTQFWRDTIQIVNLFLIATATLTIIAGVIRWGRYIRTTEIYKELTSKFSRLAVEEMEATRRHTDQKAAEVITAVAKTGGDGSWREGARPPGDSQGIPVVRPTG